MLLNIIIEVVNKIDVQSYFTTSLKRGLITSFWGCNKGNSKRQFHGTYWPVRLVKEVFL